MTFKIVKPAYLLILPLIMLIVSCTYQSGTEVSKAKAKAPKNIEVTCTDRGVSLEWAPVKDACKYTVFWGHTKGEYRGIVNTKENSIEFEGLKKGELYILAVTSWNATGESNYSEPVMIVFDDNSAKAGVHLSKANQLRAKGRFAEAHAYYCAAIRLNPQNPDAYRDRAQLYTQISRPDLAKNDNANAEKLYKAKPFSVLPVSQRSN